MLSRLLFFITSWMALYVFASEDLQVSDLPLYQKISDLPAGELTFTGSDTMTPLILAWAQDFMRLYPQVSVIIKGGGASAAFAGLMEAPKSVLCPMSQELSSQDVDRFHAKYDYDPTAIRVAIDALVVFVNQDNPLSAITLSQLTSIYSDAVNVNFTKWGELGLLGEWADKSINPIGMLLGSGNHSLFSEAVLRSGDYQPEVKVEAQSWALMNQIRHSPTAIGFAGVGFKNYSGVKPLALVTTQNGSPINSNRLNSLSGKYPLSRSLYIYIGIKSGDTMSSIMQEFFRYIFSQEGQNSVIRQGMFALQSAMAAKMLRMALQGSHDLY